MPKETKKMQGIFMVLIIFAFSACLIFGKLFLSNKHVRFVFNHASFIVISSSMEPKIPINSLVIIKKVSFENLRTGDVIAFRADALQGRLALHRITRITDEGLFVKGDNNANEDNQAINEDTFVGLYVLKNVFLGRTIVFLRSVYGVVFIVTLLLGCLIFKKALDLLLERNEIIKGT